MDEFAFEDEIEELMDFYEDMVEEGEIEEDEL
mgnify:CR=1 FL=1